MIKPAVWSIKEIAELIESRRSNRFDANILCTGGTGLGKSSLINKILLRFSGFKQKKHQVYDRTDTIKLLRDQHKSFCWNDELIRAGYKRTHYDKEQIDLIETLTQYRCNFNVFFGALPVFFTLDKELLKLFALNIDVIRRGIGVLHMRRMGRRYSDDPWDTKVNAKLEEKWSVKMQRNPKFKIPYHKYTTFVGYIYFNKLTPNQEKIYEDIRDLKKGVIRAEGDDKDAKGFYTNLIKLLLEGKIDKDSLENVCVVNNMKVDYVKSVLNRLLKSQGHESLKNYLKEEISEEITSKNEEIIEELSSI